MSTSGKTTWLLPETRKHGVLSRKVDEFGRSVQKNTTSTKTCKILKPGGTKGYKMLRRITLIKGKYIATIVFKYITEQSQIHHLSSLVVEIIHVQNVWGKRGRNINNTNATYAEIGARSALGLTAIAQRLSSLNVKSAR